MTDNLDRLHHFMDRVWNSGDLAVVDEFVADSYTVFSDPGDPWDGMTLTRDEFRRRVAVSRAPFPDLRFELSDAVSDDGRVAISWTMTGTNVGDLGSSRATGRAIRVQGITIYYFEGGLLRGHRQVVDRLAVAHQLGLAGARGEQVHERSRAESARGVRGKS